MSDTAIAQLDRAKLALAECKTVMEAKQIADVAEAARVYLERTNASVDTVNRATEIRALAERQMGEFLKVMPKATGARGVGTSAVPDENRTNTLASIGITKKQSARAQKLAEVPAAEFHGRIEQAKASGEKLSVAKIAAPKAPAPVAAAIKAGEEAEQESETLWRLKSLWNKTTKKDRAAFMEWVQRGR